MTSITAQQSMEANADVGKNNVRGNEMLSWQGVDDGQETLLQSKNWFEVLTILGRHQGENHTDLSSGVFDDLATALPTTSWRGGVDNPRSFFRDYSKAWTSVGVLVPMAETQHFIEITPLGHELIEHPERLEDFYRELVDRYQEVWPVDSGDVLVSPFLTIARALEGRSAATAVEIQDAAESLILADAAVAGETFSTNSRQARTFRTYLITLMNAGVLDAYKGSVNVLDPDLLRKLRNSAGYVDGAAEEFVAPEIDWDTDTRTMVLGQRTVREGQSGFKGRLLEAYSGMCAITGVAEEAVLEAAHISRYMGTHTNGTSNGILMAVDLHRLFDAFLMAIDPATYLVQFSEQVTDRRYTSLAGRAISLPSDTAALPDRKNLDKHFQEFRKREITRSIGG